MHQKSWDEIEKIYEHKRVNQTTITSFKQLKSTQSSHTKSEGNLLHYCSFFLPYDKTNGKIYLGHHIKANDWIPPGGHIELGETPSDAAVRECYEELGVKISKTQLMPWNLSVKPINRRDKGCMAHYDVWHLVDLPVQDFKYLKSEYYDAGWFSVAEGVAKITNNPDFANIISLLL